MALENVYQEFKEERAEFRAQRDEQSGEKRDYHPAPEVHVDVPANSLRGEDEKVVEVHAFGGHCYVDTHGVARFDNQQLVTLQQKLAEAFQAVAK